MRALAARAFAIFVALVTSSCTALFPRPVTTEERLAAFPTTGLPLDRPVTIRWNSYQVPYVEAQTDHDLAFALGLVHAHLRLGQLGALKYLISGRASELAGPFVVPEFDKALRAIDFRRSAAAIVKAMPDRTRSYLQAFVDGLNFYQRQARDLPPEFSLLGVKPQDFTVEDIVAVGRVAGLDINWFTTIGLMRQRDLPEYDAIRARMFEAGDGPTVSFDTKQAGLFFDLLGGTIRSGSNSFAVGASRSASGAGMIASDPHLGVTLPNLWVMAGIHSPSYRGVGMMIPGTPFLAFGRTPDIAWGGTNMRASHSDFYDVQKLDPSRIVETESRVSKRFWFGEDVTTRWVTGIGPIMSDTLVMEGATRPGEVVALRWMGHEVTDEITAILDASRTSTPQDFRAALKTFALPAQNFIYADARGNIAQVTATMLPRRPYDVLPKEVVLDATNPANMWSDILDPTELPWIINPPDGFVASANNKPYQAEPGVPVGFFFAADERIRRIRQMLSSREKVTLDDLKAMQLDTVSLFAREMMPGLARAIDSAGARDANPAFVDRLLAFDGDYRVDSPGAPAYEAFLFHLVPRVYRVKAPGEIPSYLGNWDGLGKWFIADLNAMPQAERDTAVRESVALAATDAAPFKTWGDMHRLQVAHMLGMIPVIGDRFVYADLPTAGSRQTVFKTAHGFENKVHPTRYGSQSRHLSDLSDLDSNWFVLLGGNDGWIGSANFMDQVDLWQKGGYIRMPLRPETVAAEFPVVMELRN